MNSILDKPIVLKLNKHWVALGQMTPQSVLEDMSKDRVRGINMEYFQNPDGTYNFDSPIQFEAVTWDKWITLPIRDYDMVVHTSKREIRIPSVVVCTEYAKVPASKPRLTAENLYARDGGVDQYDGTVIGPDEDWNIDHVVPRAMGGKTEWTNVVITRTKTNSRKADKLPHQVGLKLIRPPKAPKATPMHCRLSKADARHHDWKHFLK